MIDQSKNYLRWVAVFAIIHIATANIGAAADDARESGLQSHLGTSKETSTRVIELSLEQCITIALAENHQRPASRQALAIAEAQHRQVLAAYWPQVHLQAGYLRTDEPPNFLFPPTIFGVPPQSISIAPSGALVTIPTNAFAPGFPPQDVQLPVSVPGQDFAVSGSSFPVPEQDIKLLNDEVTTASASVKWLLFGGGLRRGLREQTAGAMAIAEQGVRRTDLQVIDSVTRIYQGAVVARQVHDVGRDTLARMEATLSLTESLYKEGTGTVKKTDYLSNKVMVETLRSAVALLEKNLSISRAALANTMGYGWEVSVEPSATVIPYEPHSADLSRMVSAAYQFNPDWATVGAAIEAAAGSLREARSGHFPRVALLGSVNRLWNDYDFGISTKTNKESATVGVVIDFPLFEGKATINKVKEAQARLAQLKEQEILLKEGLGLQIRDILLSLEAAQNRFGATREAMVSSTENRKLNIRAYQNELVETEDVIRAQLVEALMSAQHYRVAYDHAATRSKLNLVVGTESPRPARFQVSNSLQSSRSAHLLRAIAIRGYIALVLIPFEPASATVGSEGEEIALRPTTLRMIFTDSVFEGIHRADALAAITVWAERIGVGRGFELTAETDAYDRVQDVYKRIVAGTADFIIMDAFHYFELADQGAPIKPVFVPDRGDYVMEEYFLLTKRGQAPDTLAELRGHSIALVKMAGANMAQIWTDLLLAKEGHPPIFEFFSGTRIVGKPSAALLPVYFGQLDACVIDRSGFELTVELNPQIGKSLEIFRQSPPFLETVLCLHDDYVEVRQDLIEALQEMHTTPTGEQLLLVFKIDQLLDFEPRYLDSIRALRRATRDYRRENQPATPPFLPEGLRDPDNSDKLTITRTVILREASLRSENENR